MLVTQSRGHHGPCHVPQAGFDAACSCRCCLCPQTKLVQPTCGTAAQFLGVLNQAAQLARVTDTSGMH
jgi:hypothetical protein